LQRDEVRCTIYIMKRTQLYLDDDLWTTLHNKAQREKTTVSDLVRKAAREQYIGNVEERRSAMLGVVGLWKNRADMPDTETFLRNLRDEDRLGQLGKE
jgi:hypothetical protein